MEVTSRLLEEMAAQVRVMEAARPRTKDGMVILRRVKNALDEVKKGECFRHVGVDSGVPCSRVFLVVDENGGLSTAIWDEEEVETRNQYATSSAPAIVVEDPRVTFHAKG